MFEIVVGAFIVVLVAFQVWLTVRVARSKMYERKQKIMQAQLIWLLPILGAGLVFSILQEESANERSTSSQLKS